MRKRIIEQITEKVVEIEHDWLDLEKIAQVEITSEEEGHPIESAFASGTSGYWLAAFAGEQIIRLLFDEPQQIRLIRLLFLESHLERTQEFVLRWSSDCGHTYHDIAQQQYNFSLPDSTRELEDYFVELKGVTALELKILPDISRGGARASLTQWFVS